jgi:hypothetical protein
MPGGHRCGRLASLKEYHTVKRTPTPEAFAAFLQGLADAKQGAAGLPTPTGKMQRVPWVVEFGTPEQLNHQEEGLGEHYTRTKREAWAAAKRVIEDAHKGIVGDDGAAYDFIIAKGEDSYFIVNALNFLIPYVVQIVGLPDAWQDENGYVFAKEGGPADREYTLIGGHVLLPE